MFVQPFYFVSYHVYWIEYNDYFFYFQETYNNWLRERYGDDILTHRVYGLSNTTANNLQTTRSVSTVGSSQSTSSSQSKEFMALQQCTAQVTKKYNHLSAEYAQLKASHAQQRAESEQQKAAYEQLHEMVINMATQSGTCAPNPFWPYNHQPPPPGAPPLY